MGFEYDMIFKRKSVRKFDDKLHIDANELAEINKQISNIKPLIEDIRTKLVVVDKASTNCKLGEYCLLMYSENKENYLLNAGYMLEQMDLFLASKDIGACWYGLGKPKEDSMDNLDFVIMLVFGKSRPEDFRKDFSKAKRKAVDVIWKGNFESEIKNLVRYAPSACNMQPWRVTSEDKTICVYRTKVVNLMFSKAKALFYNSINMGIFLYFIEILLEHYSYNFARTLSSEAGVQEANTEIVKYDII